MNEDYLSEKKRSQVEAEKAKLRIEDPWAIDREEIVKRYALGDEQGPWNLEENHTEQDIARVELFLEKFRNDVLEEAAKIAESALPQGSKSYTSVFSKWVADAIREEKS